MDARPAADSDVTLAHWMGPLDANGAGFVHGGTVMKLCDEAGGLAAVKHSRSRVVTASMDRMTFLVPIHVGELVTFQASVNAVWHTSMEVGVRVDTENPRTGVRRHSNSAYMTMVAVDEQGNPHTGGAAAHDDRRGAPPRERGPASPPQPARRARPDPGSSLSFARHGAP